MYRSYVEATLQVVLMLSLQVPSYHVQVHRSLSKCLSALITTLGPELQGSFVRFEKETKCCFNASSSRIFQCKVKKTVTPTDTCLNRMQLL